MRSTNSLCGSRGMMMSRAIPYKGPLCFLTCTSCHYKPLVKGVCHPKEQCPTLQGTFPAGNSTATLGGTPCLTRPGGEPPCFTKPRGAPVLHQAQGVPCFTRSRGPPCFTRPGGGTPCFTRPGGFCASPGPKPLGGTESGRNMDLMAICPLLPIPPVPLSGSLGPR